MCNGFNKDLGCDGMCFSNLQEDCHGICGGSAKIDDCGICDGNSKDKASILARTAQLLRASACNALMGHDCVSDGFSERTDLRHNFPPDTSCATLVGAGRAATASASAARRRTASASAAAATVCSSCPAARCQLHSFSRLSQNGTAAYRHLPLFSADLDECGVCGGNGKDKVTAPGPQPFCPAPYSAPVRCSQSVGRALDSCCLCLTMGEPPR